EYGDDRTVGGTADHHGEYLGPGARDRLRARRGWRELYRDAFRHSGESGKSDNVYSGGRPLAPRRRRYPGIQPAPTYDDHNDAYADHRHYDSCRNILWLR